MVKIKSFSVGNGDMFFIRHSSSNFTIIDCNLLDDRKEEIVDEICREEKGKDITRFISTHPDEDHFHGIEYLDRKSPIINFYCVENKAVKEIETVSFKKYCELRDGNNVFHLKKGCSRKWMNENGPDKNGKEIGSAGISVLWPDVENPEFKKVLIDVQNGKESNNISPIIKYSQNEGINVLWFGDMEHDFMDLIKEKVTLHSADVIFAPHHGRLSGAIPQKWLKDIQPKVIIVGEADSTLIDYYQGYNTITQNSAKDITIMCDGKKIRFYCSNPHYGVRSFFKDENENNTEGYYIGTLNL